MKFGLPDMKLGRDLNILLGSILVMHIGLYIINPVLPIILSADKGMDTTQIGIIIGAGALSFQGGSILGGLLSDRIGRKTAIVIGAAIQAVALLGYGLVYTFVPILTFSIINGIGLGIYSPTVKASIAAIASENAESRTTAFSLRGIAANMGVCIAGLLILALSRFGSSISFYTASVTFAALALVSWAFLPKDCGGEECPVIPPSDYLHIFKNKSFLMFSFVSMFTWIIYSLFGLLLPLRGEAVLSNGRMVGTIWTITSIIAIITQGLVSKYILQRISPVLAIFIGVLFFGAGIFMIGYSFDFILLTFSAIVFLIGEMMMMPTTDSLTSQLAHPELIGAYFSIANIINGLGTAIGNFIGGKMISIYGINTSMIPWTIFGISSVAVALLVLLIRKLPALAKA